MILIIGGYAQGQLNYVRQRYKVTDRQIISACLPVVTQHYGEQRADRVRDRVDDQQADWRGSQAGDQQASPVRASIDEMIVIQDYNIWLKREFERQGTTRKADNGQDISGELPAWTDECLHAIQMQMDELLRIYPNVIIISDEVGNGLIPMSKEERDIRELIGRTQVYLAEHAEEVIRVVCGIGQRIK